MSMNWNRFLLLVEPTEFGFWNRKLTFFHSFLSFAFLFVRFIQWNTIGWIIFRRAVIQESILSKQKKNKNKNGIDQSKNTLAKGNTNLINVSLFLSSVHKQFIRFKVMRFQVLHIFPFQRSADYKMCFTSFIWFFVGQRNIERCTYFKIVSINFFNTKTSVLFGGKNEKYKKKRMHSKVIYIEFSNKCSLLNKRPKWTIYIHGIYFNFSIYNNRHSNNSIEDNLSFSVKLNSTDVNTAVQNHTSITNIYILYEWKCTKTKQNSYKCKIKTLNLLRSIEMKSRCKSFDT